MGTCRLVGLTSIVLVLVLALTACNLPTATTEAPPPGDESSGVTTASESPPPSGPSTTPEPVETATPAAPTETPPPTATEGPNFAAASVYAVSHLAGNRLMVTIQVPGGVEGAYRATAASSNQTCEILAQYPDRLYCTGPEPFENYSLVSANFSLFPVGQVQPVFESKFNIPARPTPTPSITPTPTFIFIPVTLTLVLAPSATP